MGLHHVSALNSDLFVLITNELARHIQDEVPWCILFTDGIVLVDETKIELNTKLERSRDVTYRDGELGEDVTYRIEVG